MEKGGGGNHRFLCSYQGLYYLDTKSPTNNMPPTTDKEEKIIEVIEDTNFFKKSETTHDPCETIVIKTADDKNLDKG